MSLNLYIALPQTDEIILEIVEKYNNSFKPFLKQLSQQFSFLRKDKGIKLFYDSENIRSFLNSCLQWEQEDYLKNPIYILQNILGLSAIDIRTQPIIDRNCIYVLWNFNNAPVAQYAPEIISEICEKIIQNPAELHLYFNLNDEISTCRNVILVFKDAKHIQRMPSEFVKIPYVLTKEELDLWVKTNHILNFSLFNKNKFARTGKTFHGKAIFIELETDYYWYLDNFHKDEYEVCDNNCDHIGTATLHGVLDRSKAVLGRKIYL